MFYPKSALFFACSALTARFFGFEAVALSLDDMAVIAFPPAALLWLFWGSEGPAAVPGG